MPRKWANSPEVRRPWPSAMLLATETEARLSWAVNPKSSSLGRLRVRA